MKKYFYEGEGYDQFRGQSKLTDVALLDEMIRIREIEFEIAKRYSEDEMKTPIHLMVGQESTVVGAVAAMGKDDRVYCSHRTHGVYLAKGGDVEAMMLELYGRSGGCSGTRGGSMHLIDKRAGLDAVSAIVGGIVPIAAGAAFAAARTGGKRLSTVFFGDAAMEEGVTYESFNLAVLHRLPILFFCENNFYSVCTPLHQRQGQTSLRDKAAAFGVPAVSIDGSNVYEVRRAVEVARARAISGEGPSFIEAKVYRWLAHGGAVDDSDTGYRSREELEHWQKRCPIELLSHFLIDEGHLDRTAIDQMKFAHRQNIEDIIDRVRSRPGPDPTTVLDYVYCENNK